tara:strand:+ start:8974 stop:9930 length:957 start_codon:yes stop_codon:yes gene_type:complete
MTVNDTNVFLSSLNKTSKRFAYYGEGSITNISLLKLVYKYACYAQTYPTLQRLDSIVSHLQRTDPDIIMQITALTGYAEGVITPNSVLEGVDVNKPVASTGAITVQPNTFTFTNLIFTTGFTDSDGDLPNLITVKTLPANGTLSYDGVDITAPYSFTDASKLVYTRNSNTAYGTSFNFSITDSNCQVPMESNVVSMTVTVEDIVIAPGNEPAVIGDRAQYAGNRVVTVFSVADFTTQTIAPYFDPEANDLDAIRIDEVSTANTGVFYYLGSPVIVGQIITNAEVASGAFYHEGPDANSISTDTFEASVRDTGSMIWVQ